MLFSICVYMRKTKKTQEKKSIFEAEKQQNKVSNGWNIETQLVSFCRRLWSLPHFLFCSKWCLVIHSSLFLLSCHCKLGPLLLWYPLLCQIDWIKYEITGGSRGTEKSSKECEAIMVFPYIAKYALLHIIVLYFWIRIWKMPQLFVASQPNKSNIQKQ